MEEHTLATLQRIEDAQSARRRINRSMVRPDRHPDTGERLPEAPNRYAATRQAAALVRNSLMLRPLPAICPDVQADEPEMPEPRWARILDLCLLGLTKVQAAQIAGCTVQQADYMLRLSYRSLGVNDMIAAGAVWRAQRKGHRMNEDDERAARALLPQEEPIEPLTPQQIEALSFLAQGIARRDLPVAMGLSRDTVRKVLNNAYKRLGVHGQREAVLRFLATHGHIDQPPYDRPSAAGFGGVRLEDGSKAGSSDDIGTPPERYIPA